MKEEEHSTDTMRQSQDTEADPKESHTTTDQEAEAKHPKEGHLVKEDQKIPKRKDIHHTTILKEECTSAPSITMMMRKISLTIILPTLV